MPDTTLKPYWISWITGPSDGPFTLSSPWWITGEIGGSDNVTVCAAVKAESERQAMAIVLASYDVPPAILTWRFVNEKHANWTPFNARFRRADWMEWEGK